MLKTRAVFCGFFAVLLLPGRAQASCVQWLLSGVTFQASSILSAAPVFLSLERAANPNLPEAVRLHHLRRVSKTTEYLVLGMLGNRYLPDVKDAFSKDEKWARAFTKVTLELTERTGALLDGRRALSTWQENALTRAFEVLAPFALSLQKERESGTNSWNTSLAIATVGSIVGGTLREGITRGAFVLHAIASARDAYELGRIGESIVRAMHRERAARNAPSTVLLLRALLGNVVDAADEREAELNSQSSVFGFRYPEDEKWGLRTANERLSKAFREYAERYLDPQENLEFDAVLARLRELRDRSRTTWFVRSDYGSLVDRVYLDWLLAQPFVPLPVEFDLE